MIKYLPYLSLLQGIALLAATIAGSSNDGSCSYAGSWTSFTRYGWLFFITGGSLAFFHMRGAGWLKSILISLFLAFALIIIFFIVDPYVLPSFVYQCFVA